MAELQGRKIFKVFNQDFIVDERYMVTKELGQGAYGIVWFVRHLHCAGICSICHVIRADLCASSSLGLNMV